MACIFQVQSYSGIKYNSIACCQVEYILIFTEGFLQRQQEQNCYG